MTTNDPELSDLLQAVDFERRANYARKKGNHAVAQNLFCEAAERYLWADHPIQAARCYGRAQTEAVWVQRPGPVNVSGLVD